MGDVTSLRDLFDALRAGSVDDPAGLLRTHGFDLGDAEVAEALVTYAHTAPVEVAADLAPYVMAHSPVPLELDAAPPDGLALLAGAGGAVDTLDDLPDVGGAAPTGPEDAPAGEDPADLDFGAGGAAGPAPADAAVSVDDPTTPGDTPTTAVDAMDALDVADVPPVGDEVDGTDPGWLGDFGSGATGQDPTAPGEEEGPEPGL